MKTACTGIFGRGPDRISTGMIRPCFLVIDKQYPGSISARKLVIETAMLNVITAYSAEEAVATLPASPPSTASCSIRRSGA